MVSGSPTLRRVLWAAAASLGVGLLVIGLAGWLPQSVAFGLIHDVLIVIGGVILLMVVVAFIATRMTDYTATSSEDEFEETVQRSERLAREGTATPPPGLAPVGVAVGGGWDEPDADPDDEFPGSLGPEGERVPFDQLVAEALDELPEQFQEVLAHVPVVVSDQGRFRHAYGLYHGGTVARRDYPDRIVIYQDTLERDFGWDPELLREQVRRTVRHEIAHHLGWDEQGVRDLGL
jgi:predicted Zn-dependent protease with MMP-like domain